MDRNSILGVVLIMAVLIGFSIFNQPSKEEQEAAKRKQDSLALVEKKYQDSLKLVTKPVAALKADTVAVSDTLNNDSLAQTKLTDNFGAFALAAQGEHKSITLESDLLKLKLNSKGGQIDYVELKKYKTGEGKPLVLNNGDSSQFNLSFFSENKMISTGDLYFELPAKGITVTGKDSQSVSIKLNAGEGRYIEYVYSLKGDDYRVGFKINFVNMGSLVASNAGYMELNWKQKLLQQEKSHQNESAVSTIYYRYTDEEVDHLSETKDDGTELKTKVQWVGFKQQYFSSVLIADQAFESPTRINSTVIANEGAVRMMHANFTIPFSHQNNESTGMSFYYGPNHYQTLKKYNIGLEKLVPLGWGIFGWVNRFAVIPVFNFLNSFDINYGIIILILTILIKVVLLPLTYKSYISTAKMKVLQPEMSEIQAKFKSDPMKLQQETMTLYRKAGVSPLGGCLPMLLQMPILIAMFRFFPASIELRQEGFLWAKDLSTYDSILDLPFNIPFYGDHVSLFTILMTVSTLIYTRMNMQMTAATNPSMKYVMYLMPIMFLGIFNNYSSGLSYYYFLANMITFGQQYLFKSFVDEKAIHAKIQENKKKPVKKSKFQERLEKMAKERGVRK
ncbi:MAG: membrane protein insertase YidC [Bacteroidia bacterium]|jgi:YidC/Oxa1 family membrane protein insertase|nr:membrane protein insertase YidC [Bacteroidia bacterium]HMX96658.1 membrane protein insertase YidC [Bacteroidia bacterium]HQO87793.1 membrane protein insertase YidC [Bacteroidia bacterium]HRE24518.1 membrane protein insertase YidC [Bacteroidia bacterium]HRS08916.1 membrane protein insertase YidC [Bacteroidia bacterium]